MRILSVAAALSGCLFFFAASASAQASPQAPAQAPASPLALPATDDGVPGAGPLRRYPWFQKLWLSKRTGWAEDVARDQGAVVFFGDSITQGWGPNLGNAFPGLKVANRGISGDTTRGMLLRIEEDVLAVNPKGVVLLMGTNDLEERADPETIAANVQRIVERLVRHNWRMPIVLCKVFPSTEKKRRSAKDIQAVNKLCAKAMLPFPQVTVLETWKLFADEKGDARKAEFPDLLHPNKEGYRMWAAALRPILATEGLLETEPDGFAIEEGFVSLFRGTDLQGWCFRAKKTRAITKAFHGARTPGGRYRAVRDRLVVATPAEGRRIQALWTLAEFGQDFDLRLEFRATPNADSGVFLRGRQLQCRDYALAGPYKKLSAYKPQDWNELTIEVRGRTARCLCNGEVLEEKLPIPASGPIGLEGDRGQMEYRRIRLRVRD